MKRWIQNKIQEAIFLLLRFKTSVVLKAPLYCFCRFDLSFCDLGMKDHSRKSRCHHQKSCLVAWLSLLLLVFVCDSCYMPVVVAATVRPIRTSFAAAAVLHRGNRATAAAATTAAFVATTTPWTTTKSRRRVLATTAAVSTTTTAVYRHHAPHPYSRLFSRVNGASSNNNNNNSDDKSQRKEGQTGWNHNQPDESSDFWKINKSSGGGGHAASNSGSQKKQLRTGWLHNTESQEKKQAQAQKQQQQAATDSSILAGGVSTARLRLELAMKQQERNHRIISPPTFHTSGGASSPLVVTEHVISVPIVRTRSSGKEVVKYNHGRIDVYFTIVEQVTDDEKRFWLQDLVPMTPSQRALTYVKKSSMITADSMILYLQGGPGFGSPTPIAGLSMSADASWAGKALSMTKNLERVILMDQRGTGKSTPITKQTMEMNFPNLFLLDNHANDDGGKGSEQRQQPTLADLKSSRPEEAAKVLEAVNLVTDYFSHFRADNIVQDAEEIRDALLLPPSLLDNAQDKKIDDNNQPHHPWGACLGQSYGGFCLMTYLSQVDHPPKVALFTGGIAPMLTPTDELYASLWQRVKERSYCYYEMYPGDVKVIKRIVQRLLQNPPVKLPSGGTLTARRFLQLGMSLGSSPSSFASLHALFASAFVTTSNIQTDDEVNHWQFSRAFLKAIDSTQSFDDHPIYYLLHESIYANGPEHSPTNWSAHRQYQTLVERPQSEFDYRYTSAALDDDTKPTLFFGEMVFPWMSQDYAECSGIGLTAVAQALANKTDWSPLWDGPRMVKVLESGRQCRAAAAVYYDDFYVDFDASVKVTARGTGPLEKCKVYITNDYQHSGLRDDGAKIFAKLFGMATGTVRTPS